MEQNVFHSKLILTFSYIRHKRLHANLKSKELELLAPWKNLNDYLGKQNLMVILQNYLKTNFWTYGLQLWHIWWLQHRNRSKSSI